MTALTTRDALAKALVALLDSDAETPEQAADYLFASGAVIDAVTLADDEALILGPLATELSGHTEHFAAWFENRTKVRHEDVGGIQCICGWSHGPVSGLRPWQQFHAHRIEMVLRALAAALTERGAQ